MKRFAFIVLFLILVLPIISADVITPGIKSIPVLNYIENIDDFPNYEFVSWGGIMCNIDFIKRGDPAGGGYKFCSGVVYAFPKGNANITEIRLIDSSRKTLEEKNITLEEYLDSKGAIRVLKNLNNNMGAPESSALKAKVNYYKIDLDSVEETPYKVRYKFEYSYLIFYILTSLIALIIIMIILMRRRKE